MQKTKVRPLEDRLKIENDGDDFFVIKRSGDTEVWNRQKYTAEEVKVIIDQARAWLISIGYF